MNKYLLRGLICLGIGAIAISYSLNLMLNEINLYKWIMSLGVLVFGFGVLMTIYSLFRKIDKRAVQRYRREQNNQKIQG